MSKINVFQYIAPIKNSDSYIIKFSIHNQDVKKAEIAIKNYVNDCYSKVGSEKYNTLLGKLLRKYDTQSEYTEYLGEFDTMEEAKKYFNECLNDAKNNPEWILANTNFRKIHSIGE